jgi:hypothetical protein
MVAVVVVSADGYMAKMMLERRLLRSVLQLKNGVQ